MPRPRPSRPRCLVIGSVSTAAAAVLARFLLDTVRQPTPPGPEGSLTTLCVLALAGCGCWAWLVTTAVVLEALLAGSSREIRDTSLPGVPARWRRLVLLGCGVVVAAGVAVPSQATPGAVHVDPSGRVADSGLQGLPLPDRATHPSPGARRAAALVAAPAGSPTRSQTSTVVVRNGDTLWSVAGQELGGGEGSDAAVSARWQEIYRANRAVVGSDPDVIVPGQRLRLPPHTPHTPHGPHAPHD